MALKTATASGKANAGGTWNDAIAATTGDELIIPSTFEVKFDATISLISLKVEGTGKAAITKSVTLTGTGESLKVVEGSLAVTTAAGKVSFNPGGGTAEIKTAGNDLKICGLQGTVSSKYKLIDKLRASEEILFKAGIWTTANQEISAGSISTEGASNKEFILGSSTIKLSAATAWTAQTGEANVVIKAETSTIECTNTSATFIGNNYAYNVVTFTGTKAILNCGGATINTLNFLLTGTESEREVQFLKSSIITVTSVTKATGAMKIGSTEAGKPFTINKASGTLTLEQVALKDSKTEGNATFTILNGTNVSGNTGWIFAFIKQLLATLASSGSLGRFTARVLSGILLPAGPEPIRKVFEIAKKLEAILTPSALLPRVFEIAKRLEATVKSSGFLSQATLHQLEAKLQPSGALRKVFEITKPHVATLTPSGKVPWALGRALLAKLETAGVIFVKPIRNLAATLGFNVSVAGFKKIIENFTHVLTASLQPQGSLHTTAARVLKATLAPVGALGRFMARQLAGTLAPQGSLQEAFVHTLLAALALSGSLPRKASRALLASLTFQGVLAKALARKLAATLAPIGALPRNARSTLIAVLQTAGTVTPIKLVIKLLTATLSFVGNVHITYKHVLEATLRFVGHLPTTLVYRLIATLSFNGGLRRVVLAVLGKFLKRDYGIDQLIIDSSVSDVTYIAPDELVSHLTHIPRAKLKYAGNRVDNVTYPRFEEEVYKEFVG